MHRLKKSIGVGLIGILIAITAHLVHFYQADISVPGYKYLLAPGMFILSLFTEELSYQHKMILLLFGQFFGYGLFYVLLFTLKQKL